MTNDQVPQPATPGSADHASDSPQVGTPATNNGPADLVGNGHRRAVPSPHERVISRLALNALARHGGAGAKGLMDQIERIGTHNTNPWITIKLLEVLRDMVEGKPKTAPEVKDPRRLARIILSNGRGQAPAAADAPEPDAPGEHEENGERFVSMPPPKE